MFVRMNVYAQYEMAVRAPIAPLGAHAFKLQFSWQQLHCNGKKKNEKQISRLSICVNLYAKLYFHCTHKIPLQHKKDNGLIPSTTAHGPPSLTIINLPPPLDPALISSWAPWNCIWKQLFSVEERWMLQCTYCEYVHWTWQNPWVGACLWASEMREHRHSLCCYDDKYHGSNFSSRFLIFILHISYFFTLTCTFYSNEQD